MTWVAEQLSERARRDVAPAEGDALRMLTLANVAAGVGNRGRLADIARGLHLDADRSPSDAAFLFAVQLHARTQDDFFPEGRVHVGAIVLAATLALADEAGDRTVECLAAGYRAMCDVAAVYSTEAQRRGLRPSGVFGPFGAAAAASVALCLSPEQSTNAIGLAAAACGGHNQAWISSTDEWIFEVGAAARAGVEAALFTLAGARAATDAFEGKAGWAAAFFTEVGAERLVAHLGGPLLDARVVAMKPYPVSGIAQVPTALACALYKQLDCLRATAIRVYMSPLEFAYPGSANIGPFVSRSAALMSVAFCVACGCLDGAVNLERLENPGSTDLANLLVRITVIADPGLAENETRIEVEVDGELVVRTGRALDLLYPTWGAIRTDVAGLAMRSQANHGVVVDAMTELERPGPSARALRQVMEGGR